MIDFTPLENAVHRLQSAIVEQAYEPDRLLLRAGLPQKFECTDEFSHKVTRRYLAKTGPNPDTVAELPFEGLIRHPDELGLVSAPVAERKRFRESRGAASDTYSEEKALKGVPRIPAFAHEVAFLLERLQKRTQSNA